MCRRTMKKSKSILSLLLTVILIVGLGFTVITGIGKSKTGAMKNIKLGLDLAGGVSITYQVKDKNPTKEEMSDTIYKLQKRVEQYSTEASVYQEGDDRINIEIPGVTDANKILDELGKPGSLSFQTADGETVLTGTDVKSASAKSGQDDMGNKEYSVELNLTKSGTKKFATATQNNIGKQIAIIYDGETISSPVVQSAITGGQAYITGDFTYEEADNLASTIRIGGLKLELEELRSNVVGAQLGEQALSTSLKAGVIGLILVFLFMILVYRLPGLASSLALLIYTEIVLVILNAFNVTLTLPGIAGIILSIGMAVDANVIIFTRIKEEIGLGTSVKNAIKAGFAKALSAIIDGNVTTLIAAAVLFWRGSGTVKGFAATLAIGIVLSMFTALFVTKFALNCFYEMGFEDAKFYGCRKDMKTRPFLKFRKLYFALSLVIILAGVGSMVHNQSSMGVPLNYSMEFRGGTSTNVTFNEDMSLEDISSQVVPVVEKITGEAGTQTQKVAGSNEVIIKTRTLNMDEREELNQALADQFGVDKEKITADSISGAVSQEMKRDAIVAVTIATICMLIYIWFRFSNITFAAGAVLALMHDVLVVLTCYAMLRWSVGSTFIACMLTIVGYSINATIVIFDRIRENMKLLGNKESAETIVNTSISQTLTRSINTTLTTFVMVLILYILGVSSIREFALPLMVGLICGTYSSVCLSGSVWYVLNKKRMEKNAKPAGKKAKAEK